MNFRRTWPLLLPLAAIALTGLLFCLSRGLGKLGYRCGFRSLFDLHCPGCGGTRCAQSLGSGNILQAWNHNAMLTLGVAILAIGSIYLIIRVTLLGKNPPAVPNIHTRWIWGSVAGIILFTILRNTETFSWLAP